MKKTGAFIAGLFLSLAGMAQENKGGISDFMKEEIADFDKFMDSPSFFHLSNKKNLSNFSCLINFGYLFIPFILIKLQP